MKEKFTIHLDWFTVKSLDCKGKAVLISIRDPSENMRCYSGMWDAILNLSFLDLENDHIKGPQEEHAKKIRDFICDHWDENIVVHCEMGVSRSASVVEILRRLGWKNVHPLGDKSVNFANNRLIRLLVRQFPQLLPIGVEADTTGNELYCKCPEGECHNTSGVVCKLFGD